MFFRINELNYFICDAPDEYSISKSIVDIAPLYPNGTGMRKPKRIGTWDSNSKTWNNPGWVDEEATQLEMYLAHQALTNIEKAIDIHINLVAQTKGYNSTESCLSYIGDPNVQWSAEATAFKIWRSQCWEYVIQEFAKVEAGTRVLPTPDEAVLELPTMVWPI